MDIFRSEIAHLLRRMRENAELNQDQAGDALSVGRTSISRLETGDRDLSLEELLLLLEKYNVPVVYGMAYAMLIYQGAGHQLCPDDSRLLRGLVLDLTKSGYALPVIFESGETLHVPAANGRY